MDAAVAVARADPVAAEPASTCFHCGERNPAGAPFRTPIAGTERAFCCAGCLAIARSIDGAGLAPFYAQRTAAAGRGVGNDADALGRERHAAAAIAAGLVRRIGVDEYEASLLLEGLTCGACAWLVESWLRRQTNVTDMAVNYATQRARVAWRGSEGALRDVLAAVDALGYGAHVYDPAQREALLRRETRTLLVRMGVALLAMMQVMMLATPAYLGEAIEPSYQRLLDGAALLLTLPVVLYCALPFYRGAWRSLRAGRPGMDVPVTLGIVGAFAASVWALVTGHGAVYFDSITMFAALLLVARYADGLARAKAAAAIERVARDLPPTALRLPRYPGSADAETVAAHALAAGDVIRVDPGATVAADGVVVAGESTVEEALLTGEARPLAKGPGASVLAGSVNRGNPLFVRASATGPATALASLTRLVERAAESRPHAVTLAETVAAWFVTGLLVVAAAAGAFWWHHDASRALEIVFAVLVVSCPCALSLATPAAMAFATGTLGRHGVVAARGNALETLARVTDVVLDKTGTLTAGRPRLVETRLEGAADGDACLRVAAALEDGMTHPVATALRAAARGHARAVATGVAVSHGDGVSGSVDGVHYRLGRPAWAFARPRRDDAVTVPSRAASRTAAAADAADADRTLVALADDRGPIALFVLDDAVRPTAGDLVARLQARGLRVALVSGDRAGAVTRIAAATGIADAHAEVRPDAKRAFVRARQARGAVVAMIGDGINDAPALAQADVSIAFGDASALTRWTADLVVVGDDDLRRIDRAFGLARRTLAVVRQNLAWALGYNAIAVPLAVAGLVSPLVAAAGMSLSSLLVVANALRLARG